MGEIEHRLAEGLRKAVEREPRLGPVDIDEVIARAASGTPSPTRAFPRWVAAAAAVAVVAGLGVASWLRPSQPTPAVPATTPVAVTGSPTAQLPSSTYRLRVHNGTEVSLAGLQVELRTGQVVEIGSLAPAQTSDFVEAVVDDRAVVTATAAGRRYTFSQDAYRGEADWKPGDYTYTLAIDQRGREYFLFSGWRSTAAGTNVVNVRVRNASEYAFSAVEVQFPSGAKVAYGPLAAGASSDYANAGDPVYAYAWVTVEANRHQDELRPTDYVGEKQLAPGNYTYVLDLDAQGRLTLTLE